MRQLNNLAVLIALLGGLCVPHFTLAETHELIISGGRLIDPRHRIDDVWNLGIRGGRIVTVSQEPLRGAREIHARGLVVTPGFIDLHSHAISREAQQYQAYDGVTTALELEAGIFPIAALADHYRPAPLLHTGASSSHLAIRQRVLGHVDQPHFTDIPTPIGNAESSNPRAGFIVQANTRQISEMMSLHQQAIASGAIGIGLPLDYISRGVSGEELSALFDLAASEHSTIAVHMRRGLPGDLSGLSEMIAQARRSGAWVHICHLQSMVMTSTQQAMAMIREAVAEGVKLTTEAYPYNAGSTAIGAAVFGRDWQAVFDIGFNDIQWVATGERLTADTFSHYRQHEPDGVVVHHYGDQTQTRAVMAAPDIIVASDAMPLADEGGFVHPRGIGTFARFVSHYVDEWDAEGPLTASQAIAKITDLPGKLLAYTHETLSAKGHLGEGADADITIFDPALISDHATYLAPLEHSTGVRWLLVCGVPVIAEGNLLTVSDSGGRARQLPTRCGQ